MYFDVFSIGFRVFSPPSRTPVHQIFSTQNGPPQILETWIGHERKTGGEGPGKWEEGGG